MADKFIDNETPICADWLNVIDKVVFGLLGNPQSPEDILKAINGVEEAPKDGWGYARKDGEWVRVYDLPEIQSVQFYLGAYPAPPTTGPFGQPIIVGMMYYDTVLEVGRVWNGSFWQNFTDSADGGTVINNIANRWLVKIVEAPDGVRTTFTMQDQSGTPLAITASEHVEIFVDGHMQRPNVDYTANDAELVFTEPPLATSNLWGIWIDEDGAV
jgi:hypothetical protein